MDIDDDGKIGYARSIICATISCLASLTIYIKVWIYLRFRFALEQRIPHFHQPLAWNTAVNTPARSPAVIGRGRA